MGATARGSGVVAWRGDCGRSAAVVGSPRKPSSGLGWRVGYSGGVPVPATAVTGWARLGHLYAAPSGQGQYLCGGEQSVLPRQQSPVPLDLPPAPPAKRLKRQRIMKIGNWSDQQLRAAMAAIDMGCPVQTTALDYDVPMSTLHSHVMGINLSRKPGRKPMLSAVEEEKLVNYIHGMARYGHPLNLYELKIKVAETTQLHDTPFIVGIPGHGWLRWFRRRHPELSLRMSQGLDASRAKGLCPEHVSSFYDNLATMLQQGYKPSYIWNCDESGAQAGRNGGARVLAKKGVRSVYLIIPKEGEWLSVLVCVKATGYHIPSFYIFSGKSFQRDYIKKYEDNASMAMQPKTWMTGQLFKAWIGHFVKIVRDCGLGISSHCRHLLILDGHRSHVTTNVVKTA
jgi:hypothetical protein